MSVSERTRRKVAIHLHTCARAWTFKAIFASADEDSDDEEAVEEDGGSQEKKREATASTLPQQLEEKPTKNADTDANNVPAPHLRAHDAVEQQQQQVSYEPRSAE